MTQDKDEQVFQISRREKINLYLMVGPVLLAVFAFFIIVIVMADSQELTLLWRVLWIVLFVVIPGAWSYVSYEMSDKTYFVDSFRLRIISRFGKEREIRWSDVKRARIYDVANKRVVDVKNGRYEISPDPRWFFVRLIRRIRYKMSSLKSFFGPRHYLFDGKAKIDLKMPGFWVQYNEKSNILRTLIAQHLIENLEPASPESVNSQSD